MISDYDDDDDEHKSKRLFVLYLHIHQSIANFELSTTDDWWMDDVAPAVFLLELQLVANLRKQVQNKISFAYSISCFHV